MEYKGIYKIFNQNLIKGHSFEEDSKKVSFNNLLRPSDVKHRGFNLDEKIKTNIRKIAEDIVLSRKEKKPVIFFTGAHLIKNGLGLLLIDLVKRGIITLVAGNCATSIHDFELALIGRTSENVPVALRKGKFGMADEFNIMNHAISLGEKYKLGLGETLGKMIYEKTYFNEILQLVGRKDIIKKFKYQQYSVLATCYEKKIPFTIHASIGTDVIDQHPSFNGNAKGGCSGRDFLIFVNEVTKLNKGGVFINMGSAVTGPEVFLKAVSMAANSGMAPNDFTTANFDLREEGFSKESDDYNQCYYFRDQKSIVVRIPEAFSGKSFYIQGDQRDTSPFLYQEIIKLINP